MRAYAIQDDRTGTRVRQLGKADDGNSLFARPIADAAADPDADFVGFFREIEGPVRRFAAKVAPPGLDPEDLAAEALARAYARWPQIGRLAHRRAWVFRVAANIACDRSRHKAAALRARQDGAGAGAGTDGTSMEYVVERESLRLALAALPKRQREAVILRYLCEVPLKDTAEAMSVSAETVKTHCERGLAELRRVLGPSFERTCDA